jgi:hypothetical protein
LTPHQLHDPGLGIALDPAFEARAGTKAGKTVEVTEGGLGFHAKTIPPSRQTCQVFKELISTVYRQILRTKNGEDPFFFRWLAQRGLGISVEVAIVGVFFLEIVFELYIGIPVGQDIGQLFDEEFEFLT